MKKLHVSAMAFALFSLCLTGCKMAQSNPNAQNDTSESSQQMEMGELPIDSVCYNYTEKDGIMCKITVDYPKSDDSLSLGIKTFIANELAALYLPLENQEDEGDASKYPTYSGSINDGKQIVDYYGNGTMRYMAGLLDEMKKSYDANQELPPITQEIRIKLKEITSTYITYSITDDYYLGGAHRSYTSYLKNISRKSCKPVNNLVDSTKLVALQPILRKQILQCLKTSGIESVTDKTIGNNLILPDDGNVPLPAHAPWLQNDSLCFEYQPYEIASYAVGAIRFKIAQKDLKPYLTKESQDLFGE